MSVKNLKHSQFHTKYNEIKTHHDNCLELANNHLQKLLEYKQERDWRMVSIEASDVQYFRKLAGSYQKELTFYKKAMNQANREYNLKYNKNERTNKTGKD